MDPHQTRVVPSHRFRPLLPIKIRFGLSTNKNQKKKYPAALQLGAWASASGRNLARLHFWQRNVSLYVCTDTHTGACIYKLYMCLYVCVYIYMYIMCTVYVYLYYICIY